MRPIFPDKVLPLRNSSWSGLVCSLPLVLPVGKLLYQFTPSISPATQITHIPQTADSEIRFVLTLSPFLRLTLSVPALFFLPFCYFFYTSVIHFLSLPLPLSLILRLRCYWEFTFSLSGPISGRLSKGQDFISTFPVDAGGSCVLALMTLVILCISPCSTTTVLLCDL